MQLWFLKSSLGIKTQSSNQIVFGDTGRFPLLFRQQDSVLKYWDRLRTMDNSTPIYKVYSDLKDLHKLGHRNWYSKVLDILTPFNNITIDATDNPECDGTPIKSTYLSTKELRYNKYIDGYFRYINDSTSNPLLRTYKKN